MRGASSYKPLAGISQQNTGSWYLCCRPGTRVLVGEFGLESLGGPFLEGRRHTIRSLQKPGLGPRWTLLGLSGVFGVIGVSSRGAPINPMTCKPDDNPVLFNLFEGKQADPNYLDSKKSAY